MIRSALLAVVVATGLSAPAHAWEVLGECSGPIGTHLEDLPTEWKLCDKLTGSRSFYSGLDDDEVVATFEAAWDEWADPATCSTSFSATYGGTTNNSAEDFRMEHVVEFVEDAWPVEHGDPYVTIATTMWAYHGTTCELLMVDQLYNGVGFDFTTSGASSRPEPDLQSIAAHEMGHWLGLDHSKISASIMGATYDGTADWRSLHWDDEDGVCTMYPDCEGCDLGSVEGSGATDPSDCSEGCGRLDSPVPVVFAAVPLVFLTHRRRRRST